MGGNCCSGEVMAGNPNEIKTEKHPRFDDSVKYIDISMS